MYRRLISIILAIFVFCSCSVLHRRAVQSPAATEAAPMPSPELPRTSVSEAASETATEAMPAPKPRPEFHFSGLQCDHVRTRGVNPLPEGGLAVSLDELAVEFCYPLDGRLISDYGRRGNSQHTGIDIKARLGDTIRAALPGVVRMSKNYSSYGNIVVISHYCGLETVYAHGSRLLVAPNDAVEAGTPIMLAGRTGRATTEHLHFELRAAAEPLDPKLLVDPAAKTLRTGVLHINNRGGAVVATHSDGSEAAEQLTDSVIVSTGMEGSSTGSSTAVAAAATQSGTAIPAAPEYYKVKRGDTLSSIAVRHKTTVRRLATLNGIDPSAILKINQRLRVK